MSVKSNHLFRAFLSTVFIYSNTIIKKEKLFFEQNNSDLMSWRSWRTVLVVLVLIVCLIYQKF